jgi:hypothetical protein
MEGEVMSVQRLTESGRNGLTWNVWRSVVGGFGLGYFGVGAVGVMERGMESEGRSIWKKWLEL